MENAEILDEFQNSASNNDSHLIISEEMYAYLATAAKWGNILAIIGFVMTGIMALIGVLFFVNILVLAENGIMDTGLPGIIWVFPVLFFGILVCYIFPLIYLNKFSSNMKIALQSDNQKNLQVSFQNLGKLLKFLGILTLVVIGLYILMYAITISIATSMIGGSNGF
jgi:hypothetical protein